MSAMADLALYVETAHTQALETLLWSETFETEDRDDNPFDEHYGVDDVVEESGNDFRDQVEDFVLSNWDDVKDLDPEQVGHDFVLSRNHHGTGFWDRGLGDLGDKLHEACEPYGDANLYLGDDERVYVFA